MQKGCAQIVTILEEGKKNPGIVLILISFIMPMVCVRIVIKWDIWKNRNDDGVKIGLTNSNIDIEDFSNNSPNLNNEINEYGNKRGKSSSNRHSKKKIN